MLSTWFVTLLDKGQELCVEVYANTKPGARGRAKELHPYGHIIHVEKQAADPGEDAA